MACDATARLYDVDENSVVFKKLQKTKRYDQGTVTFRARKGKLIDLEKLHESIWATRLSGGTRSGIVSLDVVAIGKVVKTQDAIMLKVSGSDSNFILAQSGDQANVFDDLQAAAGNDVRIRGRVDKYVGRWPSLFKTKLEKPRRILVAGFELMKEPSDERASQ